MSHPIGVFDSGFGGLTVFRSIVNELSGYDFIYLGDNARAPYGNRSFETVYEYTLECVQWLFDKGCPLVILACNTASAKALRTIQQKDLPHIDARKRVLGVIRPTAEIIGKYSKSGSVGVLGTQGTVSSGSYLLEIEHFSPELKVSQQACPMWVSFIEAGEHESEGAAYFYKKDITELLDKDPEIDTVLLACTHYPIIEQQIKALLPAGITVLSQGSIVAASLRDYLQRHPEMDKRLSKQGVRTFYTTDDPALFEQRGSLFYGSPISAHFADVVD
ncbi:glutamate racemase [Rurimicrobium arvi]|uniref:Glutamate racemase n=1 Tax=Rurimicrobium arvi TaxID=2049916 RepID=A0ABP8N076_9BACT